MPTDIDEVIRLVLEKLPGVIVDQLEVKYPSDDNGLWFFSLPLRPKRDIQVESSSGMCPFLIEHSGMKKTSEAWHANSVGEAVEMVVRYLEDLDRRGST